MNLIKIYLSRLIYYKFNKEKTITLKHSFNKSFVYIHVFCYYIDIRITRLYYTYIIVLVRKSN